MFLVFFFIGVYAAGFVGAGKNQMLAGGAIILGWGVMFAGIAFLGSFFIAYYVQRKSIVRLNWILLIMLVVLYGVTHYRYIERQKEKDKNEIKQPIKKTTKPIMNFEAASMLFNVSSLFVNQGDNSTDITQIPEQKIGIGFFKPDYFEHSTLYFYGTVNLEKGILEHTPMDSVVFTNDKHGNLTTIYAPPWLYPEHLKLDYGIIIFKVLGIGHDFLKVEVNKETKQLAYLDKLKGTFVTWHEFLLTINSVEFNDNSSKKVFVKPLDYAGEKKVKFDFMQPILIEGDWMYARFVKESFAEQGKGWIRWKKDNLLHITYSLLN